MIQVSITAHFKCGTGLKLGVWSMLSKPLQELEKTQMSHGKTENNL